MRVCVQCVCVVCICLCWCMMEPITKRMSFFSLFCLILSQQVLLALEVVFGLAFSITDVKYVSGNGEF